MLSKTTSIEVTAGLDSRAAMAEHGGLDQALSECPQPRHGSPVIPADQPAVALHVGMENDDQFPGLHGSAGSVVCVRLHDAVIPGG